ncbi:hypothetical protein DE146DRAFT_724384 [Phaeosphaeria sp. MPI-PUGE-AT-0046c]|nr:hypothetical protein DE146DRAFT_724384 [Phaeosphaeria sp. MPI-PUGE-AT-0046c]
MISAPVPYDPRWTAKLLGRDVRNLKNKAITKLKARFSSTYYKPSTTFQSTADSIPLVAQNEVKNARVQYAASSDSLVKHIDTLYELLEGHLKTTWASRDRDVSHKYRWQFRGGWLVLWMALQACPSNPSYNILEGAKTDETALLLDLASITDMKTPSTIPRISTMPAAPFEGNRDHIRFDSVLGGDALGAHDIPEPSYAQLWHSILEGATDATKTASAAKELLSCVWKGENADNILETMGDPAKHFEHDDELRIAIRDLLFPSYTALSSLLQH